MRTQKVTEDHISSYVQDELSNGKQSLNQAYTSLTSIAQKFHAKKDGCFNVDPLQVIQAAKLVASNAKIQALQLLAGGGKTFILLMLAQYLLNKNHKVRIVVPTELLEDQIKLDLDIYITSDNIEVVQINKLKYEANDSYVYICDEIDAMFEKQAVIIAKEESIQDAFEPKNELYGLAAVYHSSKAYFFSATYDSNHKKLLQQVFSIQPDQILECPSKLQI